MKAASGAARTWVIPPELFAKLLVPVHNAQAAFHLRLGREAPAPFAGDVEKTGRLDRTVDLPYDLRG